MYKDTPARSRLSAETDMLCRADATIPEARERRMETGCRHSVRGIRVSIMT